LYSSGRNENEKRRQRGKKKKAMSVRSGSRNVWGIGTGRRRAGANGSLKGESLRGA
jgi:hypothetical protein